MTSRVDGRPYQIDVTANPDMDSKSLLISGFPALYLTGATATGPVRTLGTTTSAGASWTISIDTAVPSITMSMPQADVTLIGVGRYQWELLLTLADGSKPSIIAGAFIVARDARPSTSVASASFTQSATGATITINQASSSGSYQPLDVELTAIAGLTSAADRVPYFTGASAAALATFTAAGRSMVAAADAPAQAVLLGAEVFKQVQTVNAQTGTTYTLVAGDAGKLVTLSNASAITLTLPQDSDATIAVGTYVDLFQLGAGQVTVAAGTGATLRTGGLTAKARAQYSSLGVQKISASVWRLYGDLASS